MTKTIVPYSAAVAAAAFCLHWLEYQHAIRLFSTDIYIGIIAALFAAFGVWLGVRLVGKKSPNDFERNAAAVASLEITPAEEKTLLLLAEGHSNAEIARRSHVSVNTVKTHLKNLYAKMGVTRRTQAVKQAQLLRIIK